MPEDACDLDVRIELSITPYDFIGDDNIRRIGISISATNVYVIDQT